MDIKKLAAIDIGSNGVRLLINYIYENEGEEPIFNKTSLVRMPIRLGQDVFIDGNISEINAERLTDAMKSFRLMMKVYGVQHYLAYATSAMREAKNGKTIVKKVNAKSGLNIEIIDGKVEAELLFATELNAFVKDDNNYLYVDVGGGSTELTLLKDNKLAASQSFPIGTVRLMEGKVDKNTFAEMKQWIDENVGDLTVDLIGIGGNINHVYKYSGVKLGKPLTGNYIRTHYRRLVQMTTEERMKVYNMKPDRADVVVFALEIYTKVYNWSNAQKIFVPKIGLADGMMRMLYKNISEKETM